MNKSKTFGNITHMYAKRPFQCGETWETRDASGDLRHGHSRSLASNVLWVLCLRVYPACFFVFSFKKLETDSQYKLTQNQSVCTRATASVNTMCRSQDPFWGQKRSSTCVAIRCTKGQLPGPGINGCFLASYDPWPRRSVSARCKNKDK